jgi:hypothetical protein
VCKVHERHRGVRLGGLVIKQQRPTAWCGARK